MESLYPTLVLLSLPFIFYLVFKSKKSSSSETATGGHLPPGSSGWPIIGESLTLLYDAWRGHPEKFFFDRIAKYSSPVFRTNLFGQRVVVFFGTAGNKYLFSHENKTVQSWLMPSYDKLFPSTANISAVEEGLRLRKLLPGYVKPEALSGYVGIMDEIANRYFKECWEGKGNVVVHAAMKNITFWIASRVFLSIEDPVEMADFWEPFDAVNDGVVAIPIDLPGTAFNKAMKASKHIRNELVSIIRRRKALMLEGTAAPPHDILSHMLLTADDNGKLMEDMEIATKILGILVAGQDTTSTITTFVVKFLAEYPQVYDAVYEEQMEILKWKKEGELLKWEDVQKMKYTWNVACEAFRLYPPVQGGFREAIADFSFNGFHIPKGWKIYWSTNSTHRNPEYYPDPERFDPMRFDGGGVEPYSFIPFGGGPRMCPGKEYARLKILVIIHNMVKRFGWEKVVADEKVNINPFPSPAKGLPIRLIPH